MAATTVTQDRMMYIIDGEDDDTGLNFEGHVQHLTPDMAEDLGHKLIGAAKYARIKANRLPKKSP